MKKLSLPKHLELHAFSVVDKIKLLHDEGAKAKIDQINWKDEYPKLLPVTVNAAHDGESLYLYFEVIGEAIRAINTEDFGSVWEDSCVEFFMQRKGETHYRNFECNVLGTLLAAHHETRQKSTRMHDMMPKIKRFSTINNRYENDMQVCDWSLLLEIPKEALGFKNEESLSNQIIHGNFYKCGDKTPEPHFISWNPIDTPQPNFHVPQFFGELVLE